MMSGFHVPMIDFPLRNAKKVVKLAWLDYNNANKTALITSYSQPQHLMSGVDCQQVKVKKHDIAELSKTAEAKCQMLTSSGFPVLLETTFPPSTSIVVAAVQKVV